MEDKHEEFFLEMANMELKEEFYAAIKKEPDEFEEIDTRALFKRMGFLSDDERYKYRHILVYENMLDREIARYHNIYPERTGGGLFHKYFPMREDVEAHYAVNFTNGRSDL